MDFIDIDTVLTGIADCVSVNQAREFHDEVMASEAAALLHQTLNNVTQGRPQWAALNKISNKPEFNDAVIYPEGMAMLEHTAGWHGRENKNRMDHIRDCLSCGLDPNVEFIGINQDDGKYPRIPSYFRPREIGFDRAELVAFLDGNGIDHDLSPQATTASPAPVVPAGASDGNEQTQAPERRLDLLRALGGCAKYAHGEWKFTGMAALVAKEKADGRTRCDEKTIRADLKEAAQTERDAKNAGFATGLGKL